MYYSNEGIRLQHSYENIVTDWNKLEMILIFLKMGKGM